MARDTRVRRVPELEVRDPQAVRAILDAGLVAHVGIAEPAGPVVLPMAYSRVGDHLYLHGSVASRLVRALGRGEPACATVTLLDGVVLARSAFHTSMNYRSVAVFGAGRLVTDEAERDAALRALLDRLVPGHWETVRPPSRAELRQTAVVAFALTEVSAKVRTGPPDDDPTDRAAPIWAGVLPLAIVRGEAVDAPDLPPGVERPRSVR